MSDGRQGEQGQDRELFPILPLIGVVLQKKDSFQYPTNAKKLKPKKRNSQTEGKKKWFGEGLGREIQKKKTTDRRVVVVL